MGSTPASACPAEPAPLTEPRSDAPPLHIAEVDDCIHCGLPVPRERRRRHDPFCCEGCRRVWELIRGEGLERFYDLRRGAIAPPPELRPDSFAWLDRLLDETAVAGANPDGACRLSLDVQGVHCAACVWLLQELFARAPGHVELRINPAVGKADVSWIPAKGDLRTFLREAERFGYRFGPARKDAPARSRGLLVRLGICAAAAMNAMIFSLSFYFGLAPADGILYPFFGWLNLGLGSVAVLAGGPVFFRGAWQGLRRRLVHLDLPIALGIALAYGGSVWGHLTRGPEAAYFDSLTLFVTLMVLGRWLQERVLERNRQSLLASAGVEGLTARRVRDGRLESVPASALVRGDEVWAVPGDLVPVDGILLRRPARVSLDWIDGESRPRSLAPGDGVRAGSFNAGDSPLRFTATQDFAESRLVELLAPPPAEAAPERRPRWWHRVSTVYVAAVLTLALAGFLAWLPQGAARAVAVTVSILVVTCPCALGLATPLAHDLAHGALRRRGVFLREPTFLDRALAVRKLLFDKTGTLTLGRILLADEAMATIARLHPDERAVLYNLAVRSNHPVSRAVAAGAARDGDPPALLADGEPVRELPGHGLEWVRDGRTWRLGRADFALEGGGAGAGRDTRASESLFTVDGRLLARLPHGEELREDAVNELGTLGREGFEIHLLSGDAPERVETAARSLGIAPERARGRLSPEEKAAVVAALDRHDTLMIGDGLNDGPSFEAAWASATPAVDHAALPARADFYFLGGGIGAVRAALTLARRLRTVIRDNLVLATAYNVAALVLCFAGIVTPVIAAVLMPVSSAGVVTLTAARLSERRLRWK